jgi:hypothetical protein
MRSFLVASLSSLFLATASLSGCASGPAGEEGASAVSEIEDGSVSMDMVGDYRPADGGYPRLLLEADGSYFYDTGVRCIQAPCPSVDAGSWHLGVDGTVRLVASSPDALEAQRSIEITSNDPVTLAVGDAGAEPHELTPFVEAAPTASCSAVLCAPGRRCEIIDNAVQCVL